MRNAQWRYFECLLSLFDVEQMKLFGGLVRFSAIKGFVFRDGWREKDGFQKCAVADMRNCNKIFVF